MMYLETKASIKQKSTTNTDKTSSYLSCLNNVHFSILNFTFNFELLDTSEGEKESHFVPLQVCKMHL